MSVGVNESAVSGRPTITLLVSLSMFELVPGLDNNWPVAKRGIMVGVDLITLMEIKITARGDVVNNDKSR